MRSRRSKLAGACAALAVACFALLLSHVAAVRDDAMSARGLGDTDAGAHPLTDPDDEGSKLRKLHQSPGGKFQCSSPGGYALIAPRGRYIVTTAEGADMVAVARGMGSPAPSDLSFLESIGSMFLATLERAQVVRLLRDPRVLFVECDQAVSVGLG